MKLKKEELITLYRRLALARAFEEKMVSLKTSGVPLQENTHSGLGMEAVGIGSLTFLRKDDYVIPTHRGYFKQIGKGVSLKRMMAEFMGKIDGYSKGKDSHHFTALEVGVIGKWGLIGSQFPLAVGLGIAAQAKGQGQICVPFFGDGCSNQGTFHESLNMSSLWKLPIVWICENNNISFTVRMKCHTATKNIADYANSYCMPGIIVDGTDVIAIHYAVKKAADRARKGEGPSLIEIKSHRFRQHMEPYKETRPQSEIDAEKKKDVVVIFKKSLMKQGILKKEDVEKIEKDVQVEVEEAVRFAKESPRPDPSVAFEDLFS